MAGRIGAARRFVPGIVRQPVDTGWPDDVLININFPDGGPDVMKGPQIVSLGRRKIGDGLAERRDPRGVP